MYFGLIFGMLSSLIIVADTVFPFHVQMDYSPIVCDQKDEILHASLNKHDRWCFEAETDEVSPLLKDFLLFKEDRLFYYHPGIDPGAILRALWKNTVEGEITSGASTITMQLARLLHPANRTYANKLKEMWHALQLELHYSKEEILRLYLNKLPYGGNIEGVKTASFFYYGLKPQNLSAAQLASLMLIPNDPSGLNFQKPEYLLPARNKWLAKLQKNGLISSESFQDAILEPLPENRNGRPFEIPHLARYLKQNNPQKTEFHTFIDQNIQKTLEALLQQEVKRLRMYGAINAAAMVIDNCNRQLIAYAGSADFSDDVHQGEVDGVQAVRSPGSTLKPLLYGLSIDEGLITPMRKIRDLPLRYGSWEPVNYMRNYRGRVTAAEALAQSLNVPAVNLLEKYGLEKFLKTVEHLEINGISDARNSLGLSVILGGCGARLAELIKIYSCLANEGLMYPIQYFRAQYSDMAPDTLLSPEAAYMVTDILTQHDRPDLPSVYRSAGNLPPIAWKTGTSFGRKDAWSIGYNRKYTVGIWVGDFRGRSIPALSGADFASPLLFSVFTAIDRNREENWYLPPEGIDYRMVCQESGLPPTDHCEKLVMDMYIPAVSDMHECDFKKLVFVSNDESMSYCSHCLPSTGYRQKWYPDYDAEMLRFMDHNGIAYERPPQHNPLCRHIASENAPEILSPQANMRYIIPAKGQKIALSCNVSSDVHKVYWFVDDVLIGESEVGKRLFYSPKSGKQRITCTDDMGRSSSLMIEVRGL